MVVGGKVKNVCFNPSNAHVPSYLYTKAEFLLGSFTQFLENWRAVRADLAELPSNTFYSRCLVYLILMFT